MPTTRTQKFSITPQRSSAFEHVVRHLRLTPSKYARSAELKEWVRRHKDSKYVPPYLLELWGFEVEVNLFDGMKKLPKRAA